MKIECGQEADEEGVQERVVKMTGGRGKEKAVEDEKAPKDSCWNAIRSRKGNVNG